MQQAQLEAMQHAQHYSKSAEFFGMFSSAELDEEVCIQGVRWWGLMRDAAGMLQVEAEFVWDKDSDSGTGWFL